MSRKYVRQNVGNLCKTMSYNTNPSLVSGSLSRFPTMNHLKNICICSPVNLSRDSLVVNKRLLVDLSLERFTSRLTFSPIFRLIYPFLKGRGLTQPITAYL